MNLHDPVADVAAAFHAALLRDLPDVEVPEVDYSVRPFKTVGTKMTRPQAHHLAVTMFPQTWGSTALGFGGIGGQAMTPAYTVIVQDGVGPAAVYFGGRLAYVIKRPNAKFYDDRARQAMRGCGGATSKAYESQELV